MLEILYIFIFTILIPNRIVCKGNKTSHRKVVNTGNIMEYVFFLNITLCTSLRRDITQAVSPRLPAAGIRV
jgi:hypothetical protein